MIRSCAPASYVDAWFDDIVDHSRSCADRDAIDDAHSVDHRGSGTEEDLASNPAAARNRRIDGDMIKTPMLQSCSTTAAVLMMAPRPTIAIGPTWA
jgi:hypothetical protein